MIRRMGGAPSAANGVGRVAALVHCEVFHSPDIAALTLPAQPRNVVDGVER